MSNTILEKTYASKIDLAGKEGFIAVGTTDAKIKNTSVVTLGALNGKGVGVITDGGFGIGSAVKVAVNGFARAKAGGAITAFAPLKVDANGNLIVASANTDVVVAFANEAIASGAFGEVKVVEPRPFI